MNDETNIHESAQAAEWGPDAIRARCAKTGRNPAWFLEPAPPPNPEPGLVERLAGEQARREVEARTFGPFGDPPVAEYAKLAPVPDMLAKSLGKPVGAPEATTRSPTIPEAGDAPGDALQRPETPPSPTEVGAALDWEWKHGR